MLHWYSYIDIKIFKTVSNLSGATELAPNVGRFLVRLFNGLEMSARLGNDDTNNKTTIPTTCLKETLYLFHILW